MTNYIAKPSHSRNCQGCYHPSLISGGLFSRFEFKATALAECRRPIALASTPIIFPERYPDRRQFIIPPQPFRLANEEITMQIEGDIFRRFPRKSHILIHEYHQNTHYFVTEFS